LLSIILYIFLVLILISLLILIMPFSYLLEIKIKQKANINFSLKFFFIRFKFNKSKKHEKNTREISREDNMREITHDIYITSNNLNYEQENQNFTHEKKAYKKKIIKDKSLARKKKNNKKTEKKLKKKIMSELDKINKKNFFRLDNLDEIKFLLEKLLIIIKDILKKIKPDKILLTGELGFEEPHETGYVCAFETCVSKLLKLDSNIKYNFEKNIRDIELILNGKSNLLVILILVLKYVLDKELRNFVKKNFF